VFVVLSQDSVIAGNYIGVDAGGSRALGQSRMGVNVAGTSHGIVVGTNGDGIADAAERNVISGNFRIGVQMSETQDNVIAGNYIGVDATGSRPVGSLPLAINVNNSSGIRIGTNEDGIADTAEGNVIASAAANEVRIEGISTVISVRGNSIHPTVIKD